MVRYYERSGNSRFRPHEKKHLDNLKLNHSVKDLSDKSRRRIRKAVNWLVAISEDQWYSPPGKDYAFKVKLAFVTLTLPSTQIHCDKILTKECLNQLLVELRKYHNVKNYVWKAEAQENGNLHYHIAIDTPVDYDKLRDRWNRITNKLGYVDRFEEKNKHRNPNSTDIHKIKDVKNVGAYISEYMAKKEGRRNLCGKNWGCSQTISRCESIKIVEDSYVEKELNDIMNLKSVKVLQTDYCQMIYMRSDQWQDVAKDVIAKEYKAYIIKAKKDELPSKRKEIEPGIDIVIEKDLIISLAVTHALSDKVVQAEQMKILFNFTSKVTSSIESIVSEYADNTQHKLQHKNVYSNNRRETELVHNLKDFDNNT